MKKASFLIALIILIPLLSSCTYYVRNSPPPPPPPQAEIVGVAPYQGAVWVGGHWAWRPRLGTYVWVPGHWRMAY
jgi:hypothetical protein